MLARTSPTASAPWLSLKNTAISFEISIPTINEFENRIEKISKDYPYIVYEENNRILGYAYAYKLGEREAYKISASLSIYVDKDHRREGIGSLLYASLENELKKQGIINLLAGVAFSEKEDEYLSHDSYQFHLKEGYEKVANMKIIFMK